MLAANNPNADAVVPPVADRTTRASSAITVVIVSFNTREMTCECLRILATELAGYTAETIVVDNGSQDGSVAAIRREFPAVHVIANERNLGFGAANNVALRLGQGDFFLLLNTDAFLQPGALAALLKVLQTDPKIGLVGPRLLNGDGTLQRSCFRFPSPLQAWLENLWVPRLFPEHPILGDFRGWPHDTERQVDFVVGACMLVRREVIVPDGYFDERFFMYQEEADLQKRIQEAGWKIVFTPAAEVVHLGGASGKKEPDRINGYFFESLDRYEMKHHGMAGFVLARAAMLVGCSLRLVAWTLAGFLPGRAELARAKARKHAALLWRQMHEPPPAPQP